MTFLLSSMIRITLNKTLMKEIHNNQKSIGKSTPAYGFVKKHLKKKNHEPKVSRLLSNVCDFLKR